MCETWDLRILKNTKSPSFNSSVFTKSLSEKIDLELRETRDFKLVLEKNDRFPLQSFSDIRPELKLLEIDGYTLQTESFQAILRILFVVRDIFKYFAGGAKKEIYPKLYGIAIGYLPKFLQQNREW